MPLSHPYPARHLAMEKAAAHRTAVAWLPVFPVRPQ
jgi:hypothetical protein